LLVDILTVYTAVFWIGRLYIQQYLYSVQLNTVYVKGKAIPAQAWTGPVGSKTFST